MLPQSALKNIPPLPIPRPVTITINLLFSHFPSPIPRQSLYNGLDQVGSPVLLLLLPSSHSHSWVRWCRVRFPDLDLY